MAEPLRRFLRSLNEARVEYAIVGAHAVAYHGYPRATQDLDILYLQTEQNARRLAACVGERVPDVSHEDLLGPADEFVILRFMDEQVDLLPEIAGVSTADVLRRAVPGVLFGEPTRFIAKQDPIANKRATGRDTVRGGGSWASSNEERCSCRCRARSSRSWRSDAHGKWLRVAWIVDTPTL